MSANNMSDLIENFKDSTCFTFQWFANNQMEGNATVSHVLSSPNKNIFTKTDSAKIENSQPQKVLGLTIDP